jgi:PAS domain S-box-containing protein
MDDENRIYAVCGISTDITERKEAERRLRESDEYHSRVFDTVDDMILVYELDGRLLDVNMAVCRLLGYSRKEMLAMNKKEIMLRKHAGEFGARIEKLVARGRLYFEAEYLSREGRAVPVEVNARTMWRSGRRLIISVARDMSRRRSFERERNRLITAVEQAAESIIVTDARGHILYVNPAFERITGYSRAEITAKHMNVLGWGAGPAERRAIPDTLSKGGVWSGKLVNRRKDGGEIEVEASISPVRDENGGITNYVAVGRDTTYESGLERQLLQVQKMEAVGTLAGGIAHDLNNNLLPIIVNVEMVKDRMREKPDLQGRLADALASARRARDLVRQILDFSRRSESGRQVIDLGLAVKEVLKMVRASAPENIRVRRRFPNDLFPVSANPSQLHQVVLNLLTNAVQAMEPDGGLLEVRITTGGGEDADPPHPEMKPGPYVALTVTDQGSGVEEKNLDRIFEPFFTTKKPGRGTGLGLSVAHGIVASHGGAMTVKSESGKGSEFTVYLPAAEDRTGETLSVAAKTALR